MTITVEEYTFHMIDMFITSQGVLMNILLLLLIYFCTPKTIGAYSVLIINAALVDLVIALCGLLTSIRFIPCDFTILIVSYGVCGRLGRGFCFLLFKIQIHAIIHGMMSQLLSFAYRYYALIGVRIPSKRRIALICFVVYIPTLIVLLLHLYDSASEEFLRNTLRKTRPEYHLDHLAIFGHESFLEWSSMLSILYMGLPNIPLYIIIVHLRSKAYKALNSEMAAISENTRKLHQQLLLVITIQAFLPCFLIIGFSIYLLEQFSIITSVATEFLSMIFFAMLPLANPIVVLLGVKPYAMAVRRIIAVVLRKIFRIKLGPRESSVKVTVASAS